MLVCRAPGAAAPTPLVCDVCRRAGAASLPIVPTVRRTGAARTGVPRLRRMAARFRAGSAAPSGSMPPCASWCIASSIRAGGGSPRASRPRMPPLVEPEWRRRSGAGPAGAPSAPRRAATIRPSNSPWRWAPSPACRCGRIGCRGSRDTPTQTRLTPEQPSRQSCRRPLRRRTSDRPVILVDDVFTTGATLCSAASELLDRGAERVAAVTFARAELPLQPAADRSVTLHRN